MSDPASRLAGLVADATVTVSGGGPWARPTVDVPVDSWVAALTGARDELGCDFFDWLSAVDDLDDGFSVVAHVWSTAGRYGLLLRTRVGRDGAAVPSIIEVYPGAAWPERETHEMFGVDFVGHPDLAPLLLPPEFDGHPLRKDFVLASRVAKAWPGAKEPGESDLPEAPAASGPAASGPAASGPAASGPARRAPVRPPGVPLDWLQDGPDG
jgi:NADH-quinone oxidoreductase subunit C